MLGIITVKVGWRVYGLCTVFGHVEGVDTRYCRVAHFYTYQRDDVVCPDSYGVENVHYPRTNGQPTTHYVKFLG